MTALVRSLALVAAMLAVAGTALAQAPATQKSPTSQPTAKVAVVRLSDELKERPESFSLSTLFEGTEKTPALSQLLVMLDKASKDAEVKGVVLELRGFELTLAQAQDVGRLMDRVRGAGKRVVVFSPDFGTSTYLLATHADTVLMPEQGDLLLPGVRLGLVFLKTMLDNIHVQADLIQVGKFKGAEEPFTRTQASPEFAQEINQLVDGLYSQIVSTIAHNRKLDEKKVQGIIDQAWFTGKQAKTAGLVDDLVTRAKLDAWLDKQFGGKVEQVTDYGREKKPAIDWSNPFAIFQLFSGKQQAPERTEPAIAVVYATGEITQDDSDSGMDENRITPAEMRKAVDKALKDDRVKAIVLRINSPGGSATASDAIWSLLREADQKKPVTVSMGRMAASGGYYIATAGRTITADPATITGSIGVVGGKPVIKGLLDWAGINVQPFQRGQRADLFALSQPFTEQERQFIRQQMQDTYDVFVSRVQTTRAGKIPDIAQVAQGRLFLGPAAQKAGLVDDIGTLDQVVAAAAKAAGIEQNFQVLTFPQPKTLQEILRQGLSVESGPTPDAALLLRSLPMPYSREAARGLRMLRMLQQERVILAQPVGIVEQ